MKGAGTDAQVFLQVYGEKGRSDEIRLENNSDSFEQAQLDKFVVSPGSPAKLSPLQLLRLISSHTQFSTLSCTNICFYFTLFGIAVG